MIKQISLVLVLGCLLASCTAREEPKVEAPPDKEITQEKPAPKESPPGKADPREVTFHVEGMSERLNLIGNTGPNKVKDALYGHKGVKSVEVDHLKEWLIVEYDATKVTPEVMLRTIEQQKFTGKVVKTPGSLTPMEEDPMRTLLQSILAFFTLGMCTVACTKSEAPVPAAAVTDVTLVVPGMNGPRGGPDRVRKALATLPWVEQKSIVTDIPTREVRFNLIDKTAWSEEDAKKALKDQSFPEVTVKAAPK